MQQRVTSRLPQKRHCLSKLIIHLVFTTKYRRKLFTGVMIEQLREAFDSVCVKLECELIEMDGEQDHVHLLISYPPKLSISLMVNNLKAVSSRILRLQNTHLTRQSTSSALWSRSYFACTAGGVTIETLKAYVESQSTPD
ncbi:IS200/IS605 family transposase [Pseudoalteromonas shioyasakiensis]|uniref:IS200/IS605 family transposase n=1 Tax=Pseudoalteromonas shioyasakiensis TaxID=1190813 RepID=A0ABT6U547_9GAMM|nr:MULTISPECIES: IS200/IS605 family transposase [Pseudoalteromonas]NUJ32912.1 IS200/IS605 family transposase [Pseudoalteromonas sp. 2103]MCC9662663.1 IS200/IS605 family transposase [Pseudoalteromonas sp. MB41]MDI4670917.1 IS200/IS605 family transposase [Pseudoalteromonas shioyasakiensis]MDI4674815.1 IS200/IS605 family transposase [Pseudoalteromonas shioyasakiensis]MDI4687827.1 IS200/IS605 family transposase [Pseudoalteromonas shioyasakiensis]